MTINWWWWWMMVNHMVDDRSWMVKVLVGVHPDAKSVTSHFGIIWRVYHCSGWTNIAGQRSHGDLREHRGAPYHVSEEIRVVPGQPHCWMPQQFIIKHVFCGSQPCNRHWITIIHYHKPSAIMIVQLWCTKTVFHRDSTNHCLINASRSTNSYHSVIV